MDAIAPGLIDIESYEVEVPSSEDDSPQRVCPVCRTGNMSKIKVIVHDESILDYCGKCESIYFDKGEYIELISNLEKKEHFREYVDGHLVRINILKDYFHGGGGAYSGPIYYIKLSVYFNKPLNLDLHLSTERKFDKILKILGLFDQQDIEILNQDFDSNFILQGSKPDIIRALFYDKFLQQQLLHLASNSCKLYSSNGSFQIFDNHISYTEGPYRERIDNDWILMLIFGDMKKTINDVTNNDNSVILTMCNIAEHLSKTAETMN